MILSSLSVINFKNVATANCHFAPKLNCFFGGNGMGKTNLLDAIHYLSVVRGHLGTTDRYAIRHGAQEAIIQGEYLWDDGQEDKISLRISTERSKQLSRNGRLYKRHSDHI
ncbi:MAG: AAA family ATPase, partial [Porphyromonas sp.]